jgi:hypothetical protein
MTPVEASVIRCVASIVTLLPTVVVLNAIGLTVLVAVVGVKLGPTIKTALAVEFDVEFEVEFEFADGPVE